VSSSTPQSEPAARTQPLLRGRLLYKYVAFFAAVVCLALGSSAS
jgi:hypothetical protein